MLSRDSGLFHPRPNLYLTGEAVNEKGGAFDEVGEGFEVGEFAGCVGVFGAANADAVEAGEEVGDVAYVSGAAVAGIEGFDGAEAEVPAGLVEEFEKGVVAFGGGNGGEGCR